MGIVKKLVYYVYNNKSGDNLRSMSLANLDGEISKVFRFVLPIISILGQYSVSNPMLPYTHRCL